MDYIGKLDRNIYRVVIEDIGTEDVVLIDERIAHIRARPPGDYEAYHAYIPSVIQQPDYILKTDAYATAFVLKRIVTAQEVPLRLILRLRTSTDDPRFKNSVITFQRVHAREYRRLIDKAAREGRILYRRPEM